MSAPAARFDPAFAQQLEALRVATLRRFNGHAAGERRSPRHGSGLEFVDFRPYAQGDEPRQVDWNIYARLDRLVVKLFGEERDLCLHLLVDTSASMQHGATPKIDFALRAAAALGYIALASRERVALGLLGGNTMQLTPPRGGRRQMLPLLEQLRRVECEGQAALATSLARYAAQSRAPGVALVISDLLDQHSEYQDGVRALLARGFDVQVLQVLADEELDPPLEGDLHLVDMETGAPGAHADVTFEARSRSAYVANLQAFCAEAEQFCVRRAVPFLRVSSSTTLETLLLRRLREKRFVL